jgi:hypothetical protein
MNAEKLVAALLAVLALAFTLSTADALPTQVSDPTECLNNGFPNIQQYSGYVDVPGSGRFLGVFTSVDLCNWIASPLKWTAC